MMPTFPTSILPSTESTSQSNYARKINKSHPNGKEKSKIIPVHR